MTDSFNLTIYANNSADIPAEIRALSDNITIQSYDVEKMTEEPASIPQTVICFTSHGEMSPLEIAQTLRMTMPDVPMYYVALDPKEFDKKRLIKNGFNDAFLLPWEKAELARSMKEEMLYSSIPEMRNYRPVKVLDLIPETVMEFNTRIYLPTNKMFVVFAREGEQVSVDKLKKLNERNQNTLYVHKEDMDKFHEYTVKAFKQVGRAGESETEKEQRLKVGIRELVSDMFIDDNQENTFKKSHILMEDLKKTVISLVEEENPSVLKKIDTLVHQESDFYGHLSRVATYATLFAIALELEKPVDLGLAGLLHDIGLTALPPEAMAVPYEQLSPELKKAYDQHPKLTIDIIRLKRMVISERVQKAILHHHERLDGTGTPAGLKPPKISIEGQILGIADQFDYLTSLRPDQERRTPMEALDHLLQLNSADPVRMGIDINLLKKLKEAYSRSST